MSSFRFVSGQKWFVGTSLVAAMATLVIGNDDAGIQAPARQPAAAVTKSDAKPSKAKAKVATEADVDKQQSKIESNTEPDSKQIEAKSSTATARVMTSGSTTEVLSPAAQLANERLRLPKYFSGLVDDQQRQKIHQIQLEYRERLTELETELSRLKNEELQAVEAVLTESQRKLLSKKRQAALDKSAAKSKVESANG